MARPAICYKLSASGYLKMPKCPQECMIKVRQNSGEYTTLVKDGYILTHIESEWHFFFTLHLFASSSMSFSSSNIVKFLQDMKMHSFYQLCPQLSPIMSASIACTLAAFCRSEDGLKVPQQQQHNFFQGKLRPTM
jgi:hypothetical protein